MRRLERHDGAVRVIAVPRVDLHLYHRYAGAGVLDGPVEVLADDHAGAGAHDAHGAGLEPVRRLLDHVDEQLVAAEYVVGVAHGRGDHMHAVFLKEPGMLEAASRRPVQYGHVRVQVP
jgi:hypothetical protein